MAVSTKRGPIETVTLEVSVYEDDHNDPESVILTTSDIRVLRNFFVNGMRGDTVSPAIREMYRLLNHAVYTQGMEEGWKDAKDGKIRRRYFDPLYRDGYNEGYDDFLASQQEGAPT